MVIIWLAIFFFCAGRLAIFLSSGDPDDDWAHDYPTRTVHETSSPWVPDFTPHETLDHETSHRIASLTMRYSANQQREWLYEIMREAGRPAGWASPPRQALVSLVNAHAAVTQIPASRRVCFYRACFLACLRRRVRVDAMACTPSVCDMLQGELQYKQAVHDYRSM